MNPILTFPAESKSSKIRSISLYALFRSPISVLSLEPEYVTRQVSGSTVNDGQTNSGYHASLGFCRNLHLKISLSFKWFAFFGLPEIRFFCYLMKIKQIKPWSIGIRSRNESHP